jgi:hypothetical protein
MIKLKYVIVFGVLLSTQNAFAEMYKIVEIMRYESRLIDYPEIGIDTEVEVGEAITSRALVTRKPSIEVTAEISSKVSVFPFTYPIVIPINDGLPLAATTENGKLYYKRGIGTVKNAAGFFPAIYIPTDQNKPIEICSTTGAAGNYALCDVDPSISFGKNIRLSNVNELSEESFKRELIYLGGDANSVQLGYREFKNDYARPAFSQDLKYDISSEKLIGFKGARFEIQKAGNTVLLVKVVKHIN